MRLRKWDLDLELADRPDFYTIEVKKIGKLNVIDDARAIKFVNAWNRLRVLNIGKPIIGDAELFAHLSIDNLLT